MRDLFEEIYKKAFSNFNLHSFRDSDSTYRRDCDTALYNHNIDFIEVMADEKDPENDWFHRLVFKYENKYYSCVYHEGSHGVGINFEYWDLKEVTPKTKQVTYFE